jgi:Domain of unknown function (DUF4157)
MTMAYVTERASALPAARPNGLLQRRCACGVHTSGGQCAACSRDRPALGVATAQSKRLAISQPDDRYEAEADRVADAVMRASASSQAFAVEGPVIPVVGAISRLQRQAVEGADEPNDVELESLEAIPDDTGNTLEDDEEGIAADETGMPKVEATGPGAPQSARLELPVDGGRPLEPPMQASMGKHMHHDFSRVRIHAGARAATAAQQLHAHAFTVGENVYFNDGCYRPADAWGRRLLAHELAHVVQQSGGSRQFVVQRQTVERRPRSRRTPDTLPGSGQRRRRQGPACSGPCAASRSQRHDGCNGGSAAAAGDRLTDLTVHRGAHQTVGTWSNGTTSTWPCSPSTRSGSRGKVPTPLVRHDTVGIKCDQCHTNRHGDGMGWFTGFASQGRAIGFHNSQLVGPSHESHGCVRVSCSVARTINEHSSSGLTTINVVA